jgi:hypothetical protein
MDIQVFGLLGLVLAAIAVATMAHRRRMDVLHGPYVRGRPQGLSVKQFWQPASSAIDRLCELEGPKMTYLSSIGPY